jgi:rRNA maturation protein Nop10
MFKCDKHDYCLESICPICKKQAKKTGSKFDIEDKNGEYRRKEKWQMSGK